MLGILSQSLFTATRVAPKPDRRQPRPQDTARTGLPLRRWEDFS